MCGQSLPARLLASVGLSYPYACVQKQCVFTCNVLRRTSSPLELGDAMVGLDRAEERNEEGEMKKRLE